MRPPGSTGDPSPSCVQIGDAGQLAVYHPENGRRFVYAYDKVFDQAVTQEHVRPLPRHPPYLLLWLARTVGPLLMDSKRVYSGSDLPRAKRLYELQLQHMQLRTSLVCWTINVVYV